MLRIRAGFKALLAGVIDPITEEMLIALIKEFGAAGPTNIALEERWVSKWADPNFDFTTILHQYKDGRKLKEKAYIQLFDGFWEQITAWAYDHQEQDGPVLDIEGLMIAEMYLEQSENGIGYLEDIQEFYYWSEDRCRYIPNSLEVQKILTAWCKERNLSTKMKDLNEVLNHLKAANHHTITEFDTDNDILVFKNGHYSIQEKVLYPGSKRYLCLKGFDFDYIPHCQECGPYTIQFFESLRFGLVDSLRLLYICKGVIDRSLFRNKKSVILFGVADSGKTLLEEKICEVLGQQGAAMIRIEKLAKSPFALAACPNKQFIYVDDASGASLSNEAFAEIKNLTGGGYFEAELKGIDSKRYPITFPIFISCNQLFGFPPNEKLDTFVSRFLMVRFFQPQEKNDTFKELFLHDYTDNELFVSFLLNLKDIPITDELIFGNLPEMDRNMQGFMLEYWNIYHSHLYKLAREFFIAKADKKTTRTMLYDRFEEYCAIQGLPFNRFGKEHQKIIAERIQLLGGKIRKSGDEYWIHGVIGLDQENGVEDDLSPNLFKARVIQEVKALLTDHPNGLKLDELAIHTNKSKEVLNPILADMIREAIIYHNSVEYRLA